MSPEKQELVVIDDGDELYKRLAPELCDRNGNPTSGVYKLSGKPDPEPSVDLAKLTSPEAVLSKATKPGFGLGVMVVKDVKAIGFTVRHQPEHGNFAHCVLVGENTKLTTRQLAAMTRVLVRPAKVS